jgi:hypothetical protein
MLLHQALILCVGNCSVLRRPYSREPLAFIITLADLLSTALILRPVSYMIMNMPVMALKTLEMEN